MPSDNPEHRQDRGQAHPLEGALRLVRYEALGMFLLAGSVFLVIAYFNDFAMTTVIMGCVLVPLISAIGLGGDLKAVSFGSALAVSLLVSGAAYGAVMFGLHTLSPRPWPFGNIDYLLWPTLAVAMAGMAMMVRHYA